MPDISLIILTYNSQNYIGRLLKSLGAKYRHEIDNGKLEIIVVDNNSSDKTLSVVKDFEEVRVVENGDNFGFAKGINLGSKKAKGRYLLFVNPDSEFLSGDVFSFVQKFKDEKVAVVGGKILHTNGKKELSAGKFYNFWRVLLLSLGLEENLRVRFSGEKDKFVDFVSGGFMMVRRDVWEKLGGFDEKFFMYLEDMEFCYRVKKHKLKVMFSPAATIQHVGQASSDRSFAIANIYKGLLYFHKKHKGRFSYSFTKILLIVKALLLVIVGKLSNNKYLDKAYSQALKASI
ncbi:MAG: glycosyltransferase family 2 protein [Candidatus Levyibacteriota bacterium]